MSLITTKKGDVLLEFHPGLQFSIPETETSIPMPLALIVAKHQGKTLFIFNSWRNAWELPGGMIEPNELPHEAAIRELAEETGQLVSVMQYVGWMKFCLKPDDRLELGALFRCDLETIQPFQANPEASRMILWDMETPLEGSISDVAFCQNVMQIYR